MNHDTMNRTAQADQAEHDPFMCEDDAEWWLRNQYGIPVWGTQWLLFSATYKPEPARYRQSIDGTERLPDGWVEEEVLSAMRHFVAECSPAPGNLWTHPTRTTRFRLKPAGIAFAQRRREEVA